MGKKRRIVTTNREIYNKFNMLKFNNEVVLKDVQDRHINKILNNINRYDNTLACDKIGNYYLLKKIGPINFDIYYHFKQ